MSDSAAELQFGTLRVAWLEAFVLSVHYGKQTAAAAAMGVSQGTISKHIENLETWYGRDARRFLLLPNMWPPTLTDDGKAFIPVAERAVAALSELRASRPSQTPSGAIPESSGSGGISQEEPRPTAASPSPEPCQGQRDQHNSSDESERLGHGDAGQG